LHDASAHFLRWFALAAAGLFLLLGSRPLPTGGDSENVGSLLLTIAGVMIVAQAADLVLLFVGLELISIPTYVLLYLGRRDGASQESAAKYFFLSVLASSLLLYGFSFLYGIGGSTDFSSIRTVFADADAATAPFVPLAKIALSLVIAGLCFKIAAVPFHFYAPDVYQGTTHFNAALLSVIPKAAGLTAIVRIVIAAMPGMTPYCWHVMLAISALTMTFGNVMALWQNDLRRLFAYSSIAHAGYLLIGVSVALAASNEPIDWNGTAAMWFYLVAYALATIGVFALFESLGSGDHRVDSVDQLAGLAQTHPETSAMMAIFLFSLAGIPPLAGFWGKFFVFGSALNLAAADAGLQPWFLGLAVAGALNAAIAAAYYLRIIVVMYFRDSPAALRPAGGRGAWCAAVVCVLLVLGIGFYHRPLMRASETAAASTTIAASR
jgi:NADH-quinone oxidoreductase subunit N